MNTFLIHLHFHISQNNYLVWWYTQQIPSYLYWTFNVKIEEILIYLQKWLTGRDHNESRPFRNERRNVTTWSGTRNLSWKKRRKKDIAFIWSVLNCNLLFVAVISSIHDNFRLIILSIGTTVTENIIIIKPDWSEDWTSQLEATALTALSMLLSLHANSTTATDSMMLSEVHYWTSAPWDTKLDSFGVCNKLTGRVLACNLSKYGKAMNC